MDTKEILGWYKKVPKEPLQNLRFRRFVLTAAKGNKRLQRGLWQACKEDILFYFNVFVYTYDPRTKLKTLPFITYPFQDDAILAILAAIRDGEPLLVEKARDMGASWFCLGTMDHQANFEKGSKFLMMSRTEAMVDQKGEPDSLFWKIDFIHENLPSWIKPEVTRRVLGIQYHKSGSTVTGCSTTGAAGVGGRATAVFIDEFSRFDPKEAKLVMAGIADNSPCRIWNFTPFGTAHPSYDLVKMARKGDIRCVSMHWTKHPVKVKGHYTFDARANKLEIIDKNYMFPKDYEFQMDGKFFNHSPAFDKERKARGDDRFMSEMWEIDYQGSSSLFFDALTVRDLSMEFGRDPDYEGDLNYDLVTGAPREFISVRGGQVKIWGRLDTRGRLPQGTYVAGVDVSTGQGASNSCICIANCETGEKVLEYAAPNILPVEFAVKCVAICRWVSDKNLKLCWECPGPGQSFGKKVVELNYSPVYWRQNEMSMSRGMTDTPGWYATLNNKRILLTEYREGLQTREYINRSRPAFDELLEWEITPNGTAHMGDRRKSIDPTGAGSNHGDRTIADALAWKMLKESGVARGREREKQVVPGSLAYYLEQEQNVSSELYPNWKRHG